MKFEFQDYTTWYFKTQLGQEVPQECSGKFVQLHHDNTEYVVIAPIELCKWHANIVQRFLEPQNVPGEYNEHRDNYILYDEEWTILGGGHWQRQLQSNSLRLFGVSQAYGRFAAAGLDERLTTVSRLSDLNITIE